MKKILFINLDYGNYHSKTNAEMKAFKNNGLKVDLLYAENGKYFFKDLNSDNKVQALNVNIHNQHDKKGYLQLSEKIQKIVTKEKYNYVYIRRIGIAIIFWKVLFARISKNTKIIYEIPTYPLDKSNSIKMNVLQKFEVFYLNNKVYKYVYRFPVIVQNKTQLWKKMVSFHNGVDIDQYTTYKKKRHTQLRMLIIAHVNYWHGYDRLLRGLKQYKKDDVSLTFLGDETKELLKLQEYSKKNNLKNIFFVKFDNIKDLSSFCSNYDIGIGSLGYFRRRASIDTSIKNKEYCALGLPFVHSCVDMSFDSTFKYHYLVPNDNSDINVESIKKWYQSLEISDMDSNMYNYAKEKLNFNELVEKVLE